MISSAGSLVGKSNSFIVAEITFGVIGRTFTLIEQAVSSQTLGSIPKWSFPSLFFLPISHKLILLIP